LEYVQLLYGKPSATFKAKEKPKAKEAEKRFFLFGKKNKQTKFQTFFFFHQLKHKKPRTLLLAMNNSKHLCKKFLFSFFFFFFFFFFHQLKHKKPRTLLLAMNNSKHLCKKFLFSFFFFFFFFFIGFKNKKNKFLGLHVSSIMQELIFELMKVKMREHSLLKL